MLWFCSTTSLRIWTMETFLGYFQNCILYLNLNPWEKYILILIHEDQKSQINTSNKLHTEIKDFNIVTIYLKLHLALLFLCSRVFKNSI